MKRRCGGFSFLVSFIALPALLITSLQAKTVVDDSWSDGKSNNGADQLDTSWWTSSSSGAIEVKAGSLGLVTGTSGRGFHTTFSPQTLTIGETIRATYTFTTPTTIGVNRGGGFRVGMFDQNDEIGIGANLSASSKTPNPIYNNLHGYMADVDVNLTEQTDTNISIWKKAPSNTGRLLGTTSGYSLLGTGAASITFKPNTTYVGTLSVTRTGSDSAELTGSLSQDEVVRNSFTQSDASGIAKVIGVLAFYVCSDTFGSSNIPGETDNGIEFSNIKIEIFSDAAQSVEGPEP